MPSPEPHPETRDPVAVLRVVEERLAELQQELADLKTLTTWEQLPIAQLNAFADELEALERRLHGYLVKYGQPSLFWQVVRFVGLGIVLGMAAHAWILAAG
ncbi:MAG: hypothetical protein OHK0012_16150 [Synechococcales cyanobacterium]